jgi:thiamine biosynthesis lipoprotein ApbE
MRTLRNFAAAMLFTLPALAATAMPDRDRVFVSSYENILGTSLDLKIFAPSQAAADRTETALLDEIDRQARILSAWDRNSEFTSWFATSRAPIAVSPELFQVLSLFDRWRVETNGALDAASEAVVQLWKSAAAQHRIPTAAEIAAVVASVHQSHWALDARSHTAAHLTNTPLALNSFTKSFIMDRAVNAGLTAAPVSAIVLNVGGDIVVRGSHTERIEIADPRADAENGKRLDTISVRDRAVATSGNYRRGVDIDGRHFSHIVDPRTGQPADEIISSTVVARDPSEAGALATAFSVMTPDESRRLAESLGNVEYLLLNKQGARMESPGWHNLIAAAYTPEPASPEPVADDANWNSMELIVNIELAVIQSPRVHRPYVAVWIEDEAKAPVRTVTLWSEKPKYLSDLKAWYAAQADLASIASATRSPGKYSVKWDGKDNKGNFVKPGQYTVCIEAAREHGTYQIIRQPMEFNGKPLQINLSGNTEISAASLDYRKISAR